MENIIIKEVKTRKEIKDFINLPIRLFKHTPNYVPCFYSDEKKVLLRKTTYENEATSIFFLAYKNNEVVGRIQGIIQHSYNKKQNIKQVRFTRFDCIDDLSVAKALFDTIKNWAKDNGMESIVGPLDYSDLEREGLLIEGFDEYMTFEEQYHPSYYQKLIEQNGFEKDVDWLEFQLREKEDTYARVSKIAKGVERLCNVHLAPLERKNAYIKKYKKDFFRLLDICYSHLYGTIPFSEETMNSIINQFSIVIRPEYLPIVLNDKGEVIAAALCVPSISVALVGSGGKLNPLNIIKIFKALKKPKCLELCLVAVHPDYQKMGVNTLFLSCITKLIKDRGIEFAETNLNLETNSAVMAQWKHFEARNHKRRRCYKCIL